MKKTIFTVLALLATSLSCNAQDVELLDDDEADDIEALSDITRAISDNVVGKNDEETKRKSWQRKTFFRISYNKTDFKAQADGINNTIFFDDAKNLMLDGTNAGNSLYDYKSENAVSIQWGRNISLHKKAIANIVKFAIDYTWIDLNWNNYKATYTKDDMKYDADRTYVESSDSKSRNFLPWGMQKNEVNYGMSLGPSLTIAPFGSLNNKHLMGIHLQAYYHFGYSASLLLFRGNEKLATGSTDIESRYLALGYGYNTSYGFNLSWKAIGIGFEKRSWEKIKYKSEAKAFGEQKYPFNMKNTRLYLTFNF